MLQSTSAYELKRFVSESELKDLQFSVFTLSIDIFQYHILKTISEFDSIESTKEGPIFTLAIKEKQQIYNHIFNPKLHRYKHYYKFVGLCSVTFSLPALWQVVNKKGGNYPILCA